MFETSVPSPRSAPQKAPRRRSLLWTAAVVLTIAGLASWRLDAWLDARRRALPPGFRSPSASFVGHRVPDFALPDVNTGELVRLSDSLGQRPVFLLFGSFSCPRLFNELPAIRQLHGQYGDEVDFRFVYSREAFHENPAFERHCRQNPVPDHPGWVRAGLEFYGIDFPCVLADAEVDREYAPYPARLIVIDRAGAPVFDSRPALSPAGLQLPEAAERLRECVDDAADH